MQDFSQQFGFYANLQNVPQPNYQGQGIFVQEVQHVLDAGIQWYLSEEVKAFVHQNAVQGEHPMNLLLNMLSMGNGIYGSVRRRYIILCASLNGMDSNAMRNDANARSLLLLRALWNEPSVTSQINFWKQGQGAGQNPNVRNWIQETEQRLSVDWVTQCFNLAMQAMQARQAQSNSLGGNNNQIGGGTSLGGGGSSQYQLATSGIPGLSQQQQHPQQNQNIGMGQSLSNGNNQMGMGQQQITLPQPQTQPMGGLNTPAPQVQQPVQQQPQRTNVAQAISHAVQRNGHRLDLDIKHPKFESLTEAQLGVKGGWAVNLQESAYIGEHTDVTNFKWISAMGTIKSKSLNTTGITGDMFISRVRELEKRRDSIERGYADVEPDSPDYVMYLQKLAEVETTMYVNSYPSLASGLFSGVEDYLPTNTKPWGTYKSSDDALSEIFPDDMLDLLTDCLHVMIIAGREYYVIHSTDDLINSYINRIRNKFMRPYTKADRVGYKGHYYLINTYPLIDDKVIIEDFYNMDQVMDANKYALETHKPSFVMDGDDDITETVEVKGESRLNLNDTEVLVLGNTPKQLASAMAQAMNYGRVNGWENQVLKGITVTPEFLLTVSKKDKKFMANLQESLNAGKLNTLVELGDYLTAAKEDKYLSTLMEYEINKRLMQVLNVAFNDMFGFDGLILEESFITEYSVLMELAYANDVPAILRSKLMAAEPAIIQRALGTVDLTTTKDAGKYVDYFGMTSPFKVVTENNVRLIELAKDHKVEVKDTLHMWKDTTIVYSLPMTIMDLGVNPHNDMLTSNWNCLPEKLIEELRKNFKGPFNHYKVKLVTRDGYTLNVSATNDNNLIGTVAIDV